VTSGKGEQGKLDKGEWREESIDEHGNKRMTDCMASNNNSLGGSLGYLRLKQPHPQEGNSPAVLG
jgi:hypothetical protein